MRAIFLELSYKPVLESDLADEVQLGLAPEHVLLLVQGVAWRAWMEFCLFMVQWFLSFVYIVHDANIRLLFYIANDILKKCKKYVSLSQ